VLPLGKRCAAPRKTLRNFSWLFPPKHQGTACVDGSYSITRDPCAEPKLSKRRIVPLSTNCASCWNSQTLLAAHTMDRVSTSSTARVLGVRRESRTCPALSDGNLGARVLLSTRTPLAWRRSSGGMGGGAAGDDGAPPPFPGAKPGR